MPIKSRIVVLSGPIGAGKSTLARGLCNRYSGVRVSTRDLLMGRLGEGIQAGREELQKLGTELDNATNGTWLRDDLAKVLKESDNPELIVVDSVRIVEQIETLREAYARRVTHIHLTATEATLTKRYEERKAVAKIVEAASYEEARKDPVESQISTLADDADIRIDTERAAPGDVLVRAAARLGLLDVSHEPCVDVVVGGEYGSEGKGNICFYLAPEYDVLIRVGGPNAGHEVFLPSGDTYIHHLLPSGTRHGIGELLIGPGAVLDVRKLLKEVSDSDVDASRLHIDAQAMIIQEQDKEAEAELASRIASTRQGVGAATSRRVMRGPDVELAGDVPELEPFITKTSDFLEAAYRDGKRLLLEGTQGTGLSLFHGPYPYVTSRDTTVAGCLAEAGIPPGRVRKVVMVCRTHPIRVQNPDEEGMTSGPLTQELEWEEVEERAGFAQDELKASEKTSTTKRQRRVGEFEWDLLRRSAILNSPTDIALTFVDYIDKENEKARRFDQLTEETIRFVEEVEQVTGAPVTLISTRFHPHRSIIDRRSW